MEKLGFIILLAFMANLGIAQSVHNYTVDGKKISLIFEEGVPRLSESQISTLLDSGRVVINSENVKGRYEWGGVRYISKVKEDILLMKDKHVSYLQEVRDDKKIISFWWFLLIIAIVITSKVQIKDPFLDFPLLLGIAIGLLLTLLMALSWAGGIPGDKSYEEFGALAIAGAGVVVGVGTLIILFVLVLTLETALDWARKGGEEREKTFFFYYYGYIIVVGMLVFILTT